MAWTAARLGCCRRPASDAAEGPLAARLVLGCGRRPASDAAEGPPAARLVLGCGRRSASDVCRRLALDAAEGLPRMRPASDAARLGCLPAARLGCCPPWIRPAARLGCAYASALGDHPTDHIRLQVCNVRLGCGQRPASDCRASVLLARQSSPARAGPHQNEDTATNCHQHIGKFSMHN